MDKIFLVGFQMYPWNSTQNILPYIERYDFNTTLKFQEHSELRDFTGFFFHKPITDQEM